jgi:hypothetical protein
MTGVNQAQTSQSKAPDHHLRPGMSAPGPTVQLMDSNIDSNPGKGKGDGWGEGLGGRLVQEPPVTTIDVENRGIFNFYYHKHGGEDGYHIKVDDGKGSYCNVNINPDGSLKSIDVNIKKVLMKDLGLSILRVNHIFKKVMELARPENLIQVTHIR